MRADRLLGSLLLMGSLEAANGGGMGWDVEVGLSDVYNAGCRPGGWMIAIQSFCYHRRLLLVDGIV